MKRKILDFSVVKEEISQNNVLKMAELIAFMELRFQIGYSGNRAQKMYADLYADIKHKNELGHTFSDSYDLVQEGALYLCEHYGKHLNDVIGYPIIQFSPAHSDTIAFTLDTIDAYERKIGVNRLNLRPSYQRGEAWKTEYKEKLIYSLITN